MDKKVDKKDWAIYCGDTFPSLLQEVVKRGPRPRRNTAAKDKAKASKVGVDMDRDINDRQLGAKKAGKNKAMAKALVVALALAWQAKTLPGFEADSALFLRQGVGARAKAMGNAQAAAVDDVSAGYWNPAGLTRMGAHTTELGCMYSALTQSRSLNWLGTAYHSEGTGDFGLSVLHAGVDGIQGYDSQGRENGTFNDLQLAGLVSFARPLDYQLRWGLTVKVLHQALADATALGWGLDLGAVYQPGLDNEFRIAANVQDPVAGLTWSTGRQERPDPNVKLGLSDRFFGDRLVLAADGDMGMTNGFSMEPHAGAEYWVWKEHLAGRLGVDDKDFTAGGGFSWTSYQLDYAFTYMPQGLGNSHQVSLLVLF